jgi:hypothetical protein
MRPFKMKLSWKTNDQSQENFDKPNITFNKPFRCACCCFCRPEMFGINHEDEKQFGRILDEWSICNPYFKIYDQNNIYKYKISGNCCQCGLICPNCACSETKFFIYEANAAETPSNAVGNITRRVKDCLKSMISDADQFDIYFPKNATAYEKLMIIGNTLMIDYTYFEEENQDDF